MKKRVWVSTITLAAACGDDAAGSGGSGGSGGAAATGSGTTTSSSSGAVTTGATTSSTSSAAQTGSGGSSGDGGGTTGTGGADAGGGGAGAGGAGGGAVEPSATFLLIHQDELVAADLWSDTPEILSARYAFDSIIGVDGGEAEVRAAGGNWSAVTCTSGEEPPRSTVTSSVEVDDVVTGFDAPTYGSDGLPVVFSWPVLPSTVRHTDFLLTMNDGSTMVPDSASILPNWELNERHCVVIFGDFGNRIPPGEPGAYFAVKVEVVDDGDPILLVGPDGPETAVGLSFETDTSPYDGVSGPYLVGAKLNHVSDAGEGGVAFLSTTTIPNDAAAIFGPAADYRLRVLTSGGFSPDGVRGVNPGEFERFFRVHVTLDDGSTLLLTETDVDYDVDGATLRVLGLAETGVKQSPPNGIFYDDCYLDDHDNYFDIVLSGDEAAARKITAVEIPAGDGYDGFYNPGGPGNDPTDGVTYTTPGPQDLEPVIIALDDPMTVDYP